METFIKELTELTEDNCHGEAIALVCKRYNMKRFESILGHINAIHELEGSLPVKMMEYRYDIYTRMLESIKTNHPADYDKVYGAL